ncbi:MAG: hypothetical protein A3C06_00575 [Candidatus Taylorbacteria bacterium RIFCSPHIGHO2_02_FULL_46_13]|uniref:Uncharacterized protein n=1 Tax=Candidatus Taylorbacteria bacterium RIFCSPHIGHO2_02_FULL_46_13 TaxID=1802312 RepID=A0A1G2MWM2_9BACT|nr:MAG: hypothetical protein A3C06_00575 [Candidatus Taylorbacteria bacterium RIFCSPHIGHO2_02_FULL_46_13]
MATPDTRALVKITLIIFALVGLSAYAYVQTRAILTGPTLLILSPANGASVASTSPQITLRGEAHNISFITINGLQMFVDEQGKFARTLLLANGYNIITIEAQDKFNHSVKKELQLIVK